MKVIKGYGTPDVTTMGNVNDLYVDLDTNSVYRCTTVETIGEEWGNVTLYARGLDNAVYVWEAVSGGESGPCSWNDLLDKPFYEEPVMGDTLVFREIDTTGLLYLDDPGFKDGSGNGWYHISDYPIAASDVEGIANGKGDAVWIVCDNGVIVYGLDSYLVVSAPVDNAVYTDRYGTSITFPKAGVYVDAAEDFDDRTACQSITIPGYAGFPGKIVTTIDPKFLPDNLVTKDELPDTSAYSLYYTYGSGTVLYTNKNATFRAKRDDVVKSLESGKGIYVVTGNDSERVYHAVTAHVFPSYASLNTADKVYTTSEYTG